MSVSFQSQLTDVTISSGGTSSRSVGAYPEYFDATSIYIQAPATLAESCVIQVSDDGSTWVTLNDGTADIAPPAAGKGRQYVEMLGFKFWKILAGGAAGADRTFKVSKQWTA